MFDAVIAEPGARERRIAEIAGLSVTVVHLRNFVQARAVRAVEDATSRRYFPARAAAGPTSDAGS